MPSSASSDEVRVNSASQVAILVACWLRSRPISVRKVSTLGTKDVGSGTWGGLERVEACRFGIAFVGILVAAGRIEVRLSKGERIEGDGDAAALKADKNGRCRSMGYITHRVSQIVQWMHFSDVRSR